MASASTAGSDPGREHGEGAGDSSHVRAPKQKRSRRTLERLVQAALEIIEEDGVGAVTVAAVVDRAESSVGSFYARFSGKDELLLYLEERVWEEARRHWDEAVSAEAWDGLTLEGVVASVVRLLVRIQEEAVGTRRALGADAAGAGLGDEAVRFHARLQEEVGEMLLRRRSEIDHPRPELAVAVAYRWAVAGIRELASGMELSRKEVIDEVTRSLAAYLGGPGDDGDSDPSKQVEFFDVWQ